MPFEDYVFNSRGLSGSGNSYSEFNALGCNAALRHPSEFFLYDTFNGCKPQKVKQYWSYWRADSVKEELDRITEGWDK